MDKYEEALQILNKLYIKYYFEDKNYYKMTKADMIQKCIEVLKTIETLK